MAGLEKQLTTERVAQDGRTLQFATAKLKGDREIVLAAVGQDGRALKFAAAPLKADRGVVLAAVAQDGRALQFAAAKLKGDREIVVVAVSQAGRALQFAVAKLKMHPLALQHRAPMPRCVSLAARAATRSGTLVVFGRNIRFSASICNAQFCSITLYVIYQSTRGRTRCEILDQNTTPKW